MPTDLTPVAEPAPHPQPAPHPRMRRLHRAGWTIKSLATLFVIAFLCAYAKTYSRYGTPHTQTQAAVATHSFFHTSPATRSQAQYHQPTILRVRSNFRRNRRSSFYHYHLATFRSPRHPRRRSLFHLASLRLHHLFNEILAVQS